MTTRRDYPLGQSLFVWPRLYIVIWKQICRFPVLFVHANEVMNFRKLVCLSLHWHYCLTIWTAKIICICIYQNCCYVHPWVHPWSIIYFGDMYRIFNFSTFSFSPPINPTNQIDSWVLHVWQRINFNFTNFNFTNFNLFLFIELETMNNYYLTIYWTN